MRRAARQIAWLVALWSAASALGGALPAAETDPKPVPRGGPRAQAIVEYNEGVRLMLERRFAGAQAHFEAALAIDETIAEAHSNLAFSLRRRSAANFVRALAHYNRALELDPRLAQAYMYRGVLLSQMGDTETALADYQRLIALDEALAMRLLAAIQSGEGDDVYDGLAPQLD